MKHWLFQLVPAFLLAFSSSACRTPANHSDADAVPHANAADDLDSTAAEEFSILDVDYEIRGYMPLKVFVIKDSLLSYLQQKIAAKEQEFSPPSSNEVKDIAISHVVLDLTDGGLSLNFRLNFSFRKCVGGVCGWWQPAQTSNELIFQVSVESWVLLAKLADVKVHIDNQFLGMVLGKTMAAQVADIMSKQINQGLARVSGKSLQDMTTASVPAVARSVLSNFTSFDAAIYSEGVQLTLRRHAAAQ